MIEVFLCLDFDGNLRNLHTPLKVRVTSSLNCWVPMMIFRAQWAGSVVYVSCAYYSHPSAAAAAAASVLRFKAAGTLA